MTKATIKDGKAYVIMEEQPPEGCNKVTEFHGGWVRFELWGLTHAVAIKCPIAPGDTVVEGCELDNVPRGGDNHLSFIICACGNPGKEYEVQKVTEVELVDGIWHWVGVIY